MKRALTLAERARGYTETNPLVGAVIVKDNRIIAEGYHHVYGGDHAEVDAIKGATEAVAGSTMFVTLDPCCHVGKTPPCTGALITSGIGKVYAAMIDPDPQVAGQGISKLREAGIVTEVGLCEEEARKVNEAYIKYKTTGRPFVTLKIAQTLDGKIADGSRNSKWITSDESRKRVHQLRAEHDAILVGAGTVRTDNPTLTTHDVKGRNPIRLILSQTGELSEELGVFNDDEKERTYVVTSQSDSSERSFQRWTLPQQDDGSVDLNALLAKAGESRITSLLVEGGSEVFSCFISSGLVDKFLFVIAPKLLGSGLSAFIDSIERSIDRTIKLRFERVEQLGGDVWVEAYPE